MEKGPCLHLVTLPCPALSLHPLAIWAGPSLPRLSPVTESWVGSRDEVFYFPTYKGGSSVIMSSQKTVNSTLFSAMPECPQTFHFLVTSFVNTLVSSPPPYVTTWAHQGEVNTEANVSLSFFRLKSWLGHRSWDRQKRVIWISLVGHVYMLISLRDQVLLINWYGNSSLSFWEAGPRCSYHTSRWVFCVIAFGGVGNTHCISVG